MLQAKKHQIAEPKPLKYKSMIISFFSTIHICSFSVIKQFALLPHATTIEFQIHAMDSICHLFFEVLMLVDLETFVILSISLFCVYSFPNFPNYFSPIVVHSFSMNGVRSLISLWKWTEAEQREHLRDRIRGIIFDRFLAFE